MSFPCCLPALHDNSVYHQVLKTQLKAAICLFYVTFLSRGNGRGPVLEAVIATTWRSGCIFHPDRCSHVCQYPAPLCLSAPCSSSTEPGAPGVLWLRWCSGRILGGLSPEIWFRFPQHTLHVNDETWFPDTPSMLELHLETSRMTEHRCHLISSPPSPRYILLSF